VDQDSVATTTGEGRNGGAAPDGRVDGLMHPRRQSDWTGQGSADQDAAASAYRAALDVATATLTAYDGGTASHSDDVVTLCLALAEQLGVHNRERAYLLAAAELHDIGKVGVPPRILSKPAALEPDEWRMVREHTLTGERILGAVPELAEVARIVRHCHERWDGGGYPDGLAGEQIPLCARIVFCADAFHAIRGDRPYRSGRSARAALAEVQKHAGTQFDPGVVEALATVAAHLGERRGRGLSVHLGGRRSQRLAVLLLTLAVGGGAMAATGIWDRSKGRASPEDTPGGQSTQPGAPADARGSTRDASSARVRANRPEGDRRWARKKSGGALERSSGPREGFRGRRPSRGRREPPGQPPRSGPQSGFVAPPRRPTGPVTPRTGPAPEPPPAPPPRRAPKPELPRLPRLPLPAVPAVPAPPVPVPPVQVPPVVPKPPAVPAPSVRPPPSAVPRGTALPAVFRASAFASTRHHGKGASEHREGRRGTHFQGRGGHRGRRR
jgi:hypothetical protein